MCVVVVVVVVGVRIVYSFCLTANYGISPQSYKRASDARKEAGALTDLAVETLRTLCGRWGLKAGLHRIPSVHRGDNDLLEKGQRFPGHGAGRLPVVTVTK